MATLSIALGYAEAASTRTTNIPVILYIGDDVEQAKKAIHNAGKNGTILEGQILQHLSDHITYRHHFDPKTVGD